MDHYLVLAECVNGTLVMVLVKDLATAQLAGRATTQRGIAVMSQRLGMEGIGPGIAMAYVRYSANGIPIEQGHLDSPNLIVPSSGQGARRSAQTVRTGGAQSGTGGWRVRGGRTSPPTTGDIYPRGR